MLQGGAASIASSRASRASTDHVLKLMRKGTTGAAEYPAAQVVRASTASRPRGTCSTASPGRRPKTIEQMLRPASGAFAIFSLPTACGPIRLDRFSPYSPAGRQQFGLNNVRPFAVYRLSLSVQAADSTVAHRLLLPLRLRAGRPRKPGSTRCGTLGRSAARLRGRGQPARTSPSRWWAPPRRYPSQAKTAALKLSAFERCIVMRIDELSSVAQVMEALAQGFPTKRFAEEDVRAFLTNWSISRWR